MQKLDMAELNLAEINEVSGACAGTPAPQTVVITGKRMNWAEKIWYDLFG